MGRRGPIPKKPELRIVTGTTHHEPAPAAFPKPPTVRPACPKWLRPAAKAEWRRIMPELERLDLVSKLDRSLLAIYCQSWARYEEAELKIEDLGATFSTEQGFEGQSPWVTISAKMVAQINAIAKEFGMSVGARMRLQVKTPDDTVDDELDDIEGKRAAR